MYTHNAFDQFFIDLFAVSAFNNSELLKSADKLLFPCFHSVTSGELNV